MPFSIDVTSFPLKFPFSVVLCLFFLFFVHSLINLRNLNSSLLLVIEPYFISSSPKFSFYAKERDITASYTDSSGTLKTYTIPSKDLSTSWIWESSPNRNREMLDDDMKFRQMRKTERAAHLSEQRRDSERQMETEALARSKDLDNRLGGKYSVWRREYENQKPDSTLKLMKDQIIMAKVYASIAHSKGESGLYKSLMKHIKESKSVIGEANSDAELRPG
ncbi:unnamed protein product [Spirodela intermedia]|uniref:Uncharacterized protein n=1 Tax=Spirodela intermedia TaxID=51605 RepID=A0A7I8K477_SPIIN|nr:unnamed protein product [Spirodela intermedia]